MIYKEMGHTGVELSLLSMGGHEYLQDGRSRGFNENFQLATRPGHIFEGFGQDRRKTVLQIAFEHGINFFDVTQDSEKEALGRNLKEITPPYDIYVQTRPEGMVYTYDAYNERMTHYESLQAEIQRGLKLLQRESLEFLNLAFMKNALDHDPEYLAKISYNIQKLKKKGLIRYACADTFSGEETYLRQIAAGCFDAIYINFNFGDDGANRRVLKAASQKKMGVIAREAFMKGELYKMGAEAGITDRGALARAALKWTVSHPEVTTVLIGTNNPDHLLSNLEVANDARLAQTDWDLIDRVKRTGHFKAFDDRKTKEFFTRE